MMIEQKIVKEIMIFYGLSDYENYEVDKITADNIRVKCLLTNKIVNLRY